MSRRRGHRRRRTLRWLRRSEASRQRFCRAGGGRFRAASRPGRAGRCRPWLFRGGSSCAQARAGARCCASSTCSLPSWLRALREDVEDQAVRVPTTPQSLRSRLRCWAGRQFVVEDDVGRRLKASPIFSRLAAKWRQSRDPGAAALSRPLRRWRRPAEQRTRQALGSPCRASCTRTARARSGTKHDQQPFCGRRCAGGPRILRLAPFLLDDGRAGGHDRGNGVLVDHLGDGVLEQDDVLVEGLIWLCSLMPLTR